MHIPAPKMPLPGHAESYRPPKEYLLTEEEQQQWEVSGEDVNGDHGNRRPYIRYSHSAVVLLSYPSLFVLCSPGAFTAKHVVETPSTMMPTPTQEMDPSERPTNFIPKSFDSLRQVQ